MKKKIAYCMLSELLYHAIKSPDTKEAEKFLTEYKRRCSLINMTPKQAARLYSVDKKAILEKSSYIQLDAYLATMPEGSRPPAFLVAPTLSELIKYVNTDMCISITNQTWINKNSWDAVCFGAFWRSDCMAARVLRNTLNFYVGLNKQQTEFLIAQEFRILRHLYYRYPDEMVAWAI